MQIQIDIRKSADAYLEFYKALTSGDTGFPEKPPEVERDIIEVVNLKKRIESTQHLLSRDESIS